MNFILNWLSKHWVTTLGLILGYAMGIVTSYIATILYERNRLRKENKDLRRILAFSNAGVLFVLAHREKREPSVMPRIAIEDFFAMHNISRAVAALSGNRPTRIRDVGRLTAQDKTNYDIVSIGGPKVNSLTEEILAACDRSTIFRFEAASSTRWYLKREDSGGTHESKSYEKDGSPPEEERSDLAVVMRVPNPWNKERKAVVVAGLRGIGTWGAAELIRKKPRAFFQNDGSGDFIALLKIRYVNYDILESRVDHMIPLG